MRAYETVEVSSAADVILNAVRAAIADAGRIIEALTQSGRQQSLALTKLEEAAMWATQAVADQHRIG